MKRNIFTYLTFAFIMTQTAYASDGFDFSTFISSHDKINAPLNSEDRAKLINMSASNRDALAAVIAFEYWNDGPYSEQDKALAFKGFLEKTVTGRNRAIFNETAKDFVANSFPIASTGFAHKTLGNLNSHLVGRMIFDYTYEETKNDINTHYFYALSCFIFGTKSEDIVKGKTVFLAWLNEQSCNQITFNHFERFVGILKEAARDSTNQEYKRDLTNLIETYDENLVVYKNNKKFEHESRPCGGILSVIERFLKGHP